MDRAGLRLQGMNRFKNVVLAILASAKAVYVCPMHPEIVADAPGVCPKCNMKLDPKPQVESV